MENALMKFQKEIYDITDDFIKDGKNPIEIKNGLSQALKSIKSSNIDLEVKNVIISILKSQLYDVEKKYG